MGEYEPMDQLSLDFWGARVDVTCSPADVEDLRFFYGSYITAGSGDPDISVTLECTTWPSRGFFTSSLARDMLEKRITVTDHRESRRSGERLYRDWSDVVSPFPPFASAALASRTATFPGALVRAADGRTTALLGDHYVGKTSTAIAWCRDHGSSLISDSLIVLDVSAGVALRFETPLGFRRDGLKEIIPRLEHVDHRLTVSADTGLVALVRPQDVLGTSNSSGGNIDHVVVLSETQEATATATWTRTRCPNLGWFTEASIDAVTSLLPDSALRVNVPKRSSPTERAAAIIDAIRQEERA